MKPLVASYSFLRDEENCPRKAYHKYVLKDIPFVETPQIVYGNQVHKAMERRINERKPLPADMQHFEVFAKPFEGDTGTRAEMSLGMREDGSACDFFDDKVFLRGKIDVARVAGDKALCVDWKTGKMREEPYELELHGLLLHSRFNELTKITGRFVWLKEMKLGPEHDLSDTGATYKSVKDRMTRIREAAKTNYWPPRQNPLCAWCDVLSCEFNKKGVSNAKT